MSTFWSLESEERWKEEEEGKESGKASGGEWSGEKDEVGKGGEGGDAGEERERKGEEVTRRMGAEG
eukprot:751643-Hanusia_phi.AAC.2